MQTWGSTFNIYLFIGLGGNVCHILKKQYFALSAHTQRKSQEITKRRVHIRESNPAQALVTTRNSCQSCTSQADLTMQVIVNDLAVAQIEPTTTMQHKWSTNDSGVQIPSPEEFE